LANRAVNLTKRIWDVQARNKQGGKEPGYRYCPVALSGNGRVKPNVVIVNGQEEVHPEGAYYLEWRDGSKRHRLSVGKHAADASARRLAKEAELNAINHGVAVAPEKKNGHRPLAEAILDYLNEIKLTKKPRSYLAYSLGLRYFEESCRKRFVESVERRDLLEFAAYLRDEKELAPRSVYNKFEVAMSFLKSQGVRGLVSKNDWPRYTQEEPEIYEQEDLDALFTACDPEERLWFEFFLMTGMRDQEVMYAYWSDVNFNHATVRVSHKPDRGWTPKAYKEREIPIPEKLVAALRNWRPKSDKRCNLIFPAAGCQPRGTFLDRLKAVAKRAGLPRESFWLHKFRATFATRCLWAGVDLRTVQLWLGHSDIESTMRYLKPSRSQQVREKVNEIFA
jgi:integrase